MITTAAMEGRPAGITYLTTGGLKEDMVEITRTLEDMMTGAEPGISDVEFRSLMMTRMNEVERQLAELYDGMNYIGEALMKNGIIPRSE